MSTYEVRQTPTAVKRNGSKTLSVHDSYAGALDALDLEGLTSKRVLLVVKINSDATEDVMAIADHRR